MNCTFIIPALNAEETIKICIDSIIAEMKEDDEILVIDNGSTDNTKQIAKKYKSIRIFEINDKSIAALRNFGAKQAKGELLAFIDSDCVIKPGWRKNAVRILAEKTYHATGCKCDIPMNANWIEKTWYSQKKNGEYEVNYINSGNFIVKKDVFSDCYGFNEDLITGEDSELCWKIRSKKYKIINSDKVGAIHLDNPKNLFSFFKKEKWHGIGMFGTFNINKFDKPLIATILFILLHLLGLYLFFLTKMTVLTLVLFFSIPIFSSLFRLIQFHNYRYFINLVWLYYIYFLSRAVALFEIIFKNLIAENDKKRV